MAVVTLAAVVLAVFVALHTATGGGSQVADEGQVKAAAQKQLDLVKNQNLPPGLKAEIIAREQGLLQQSSKGANTGPPPAGQ